MNGYDPHGHIRCFCILYPLKDHKLVIIASVSWRTWRAIGGPRWWIIGRPRWWRWVKWWWRRIVRRSWWRRRRIVRWSWWRWNRNRSYYDRTLLIYIIIWIHISFLLFLLYYMKILPNCSYLDYKIIHFFIIFSYLLQKKIGKIRLTVTKKVTIIRLHKK